MRADSLGTRTARLTVVRHPRTRVNRGDSSGLTRRTLLATASAATVSVIAGCADAVLGDRRLVTPITLTIVNEDDENHFVILRAEVVERDRGSYEEEISVNPGDEVHPAHLRGVRQELYVTLRPGGAETVTITEATKHVHIVIENQSLEIHVEERG